MTTPPEDLIALGRIIGGHGVRGWVKVQPFSSDSDVLALATQWWIGRPAGPLSGSSAPETPRVIDVLWARPHGSTYLASIKSVADRTAADQIKGHTVFVARQAFPALGVDEYYWVDLIGCKVTTDESGQIQTLGVVHEILDNPAHPILSVKQQCLDVKSNAMVDRLDDKARPIFSLIPFVAAHVEAVDLPEKTITTHWPTDF
jgi:16S rRNA processing protein RimM